MPFQTAPRLQGAVALPAGTTLATCRLRSPGVVRAAAGPTGPAAPAKRVRAQFPDGSSYYGETRGGRIHGQGEWRSAAGEVYIGAFEEDVFSGQGRYTDAGGNTYVGSFAGGVFNGPGTYLYGDGRAEVGTYVQGVDAGDGARWSLDRTQAWRLKAGEVVGDITLEEAAGVAASIGLPVPSSIYEMGTEGRARLAQRIARLSGGGSDDVIASFQGLVEDYIVPGPLIAHSLEPVVSPAECAAVIAECEARAKSMGGWTTERHANYPTTDVPLQRLPHCPPSAQAMKWFCEKVLPDIAFPFIVEAFGGLFPPPEGPSGGEGDPRGALKVVDAFVVKYDAAAGQTMLKPHRDGSVFSFNVALNDLGEYEGGGTYFRQLEGPKEGSGSVRSAQGHILAHSSALMHGGHPITSGVRYLLVAFISVEPAYLPWGYAMYEHVKKGDGPDAPLEEEMEKDKGAEAEGGVPLGGEEGEGEGKGPTPGYTVVQ